jgi:acyl-CoA synthetase (AMP-forming)/AMP-acid ligase II
MGTRLVAYVAAAGQDGVQAAALRQALAAALPDYMVPSAIVVLDSLPLNSNGKVDRKALPRVELARVAEYQAPKGRVEQALAEVWAEVLQVPQVGRQDDFFELGGH